ncbi:MAG: D-alanyl-D-alanine carboxypeptidase, partial [Oscillospiraceae bacterium]|nr:D-alanyl-D-alanine carboxypeptidase [Oscillospiraceae bacterium]
MAKRATYPLRFAAHIAAAALLLALIPAPARAEAPENGAASAFLYEANTGTVLYEKNADEKRLIASLTKIMTALVVLERTDPDEEVRVRAEWTDVEGSKMGLVPGETLTVRDLLYGLLLASGNDAALALACHTAGSIEAFAALMNEKAAELGLRSTSFENPHGLDGPAQYSTARDMAAL